MFRIGCIGVLLLTVAGALQAATWGESLLDETAFDFGAVPRGQMLTHPFRIVNKTDKTVQIGNVRVSCGQCSSARALQTTLAPGQETVILAQMNTSRFIGVKSITIYVTLHSTQIEEVRLTLQANSRDDVSFNPDALTFGRIKRGESPTASMTITFFGGTPTKILDARSDSNYVQLAVKEVRQAVGDLNYQLEAKVRGDTPPGRWYTDIWLRTDNATMAKLRVPLTVEVEAPVSVSPQAISLGEIKQGTESERKVILRGTTPFRITSISGTDREIRVQEVKSEKTSVHVLTVTLRPQAVGELNRTIRVQTDMKANSEITFQAIANITP